jgi:Tol biopolymer transport system component
MRFVNAPCPDLLASLAYGIDMTRPLVRSLIVALLPILASSCTRTSQSGSTAREVGGDQAQPGLTQLAAAPATRRVWKGPTVDFEGRPSPDGRFISTTDWGTGNLGLRDLVTDSTRPVTNKGSWADSEDFAEASVISPDGRTIVYGWFSMKGLRFELRSTRIAGPDSGKTRTIFSSPDVEFNAPQSFTPDGRSIATVLYRHDRTTQIALIPTDSGPARVLKSFDWRTPNDLAVSPDGRWLAYDFPRNQDDPERDVFVMALDGSGESVVLRDKGNDIVAGWTPDGTHLLVGSARSGTPGVWALAMVNGRTHGNPVLVRADVWRMTPLGTSGDGSVFYGLQTGERDLYTAAFDPKSGKVLSQPVSASGGAFNASPYTMAFSPDGQHVAYIVTRGSGTNPYSQSDLVIRSLEQGEVRRLAPELSRITRVYWMPDGRSMLVRGANQKGRGGLYRVALESGAVTPLYQQDAIFPNSAAIALDGARVFFVTNDSAFVQFTVNAVDVASGTTRAIYTAPRGQNFAGMAMSPDGRQLALATRTRTPGTSRIELVSVENGTARELYRLPATDDLASYSSVVWAQDGGHLYFAATTGPQGVNVPTVEMRRIPAQGGPAETIDLKRVGLSVFQLSPDGRRIAFGVSDFASEVWVMAPPNLSLPVKAAGAR